MNTDLPTLPVHSFGHCSLAHPSLCTAKTLRAYFVDGTVPAQDPHCDADDGFLFPHPDEESLSAPEALSSEDTGLRRAMWDLARSADIVAMGPRR